MHKILVTLSLGLFISLPVFANSVDAVRDGHTLRFTGDINVENSQILRKHLRDGVTTLIVNSVGGDAKAGLAIAQEMLKRKTNLIVDQYCFSTCANYLFLAATEKSLSPNAILGFHGGIQGVNPFKKITKSALPALKVAMRDMSLLWQHDELFFKQIGVDRELIKNSFELTKVIKSATTYTVTVTGEKFIFSENQVDEAFALRDKMAKKGEKAELVVVGASMQSTNKVYFPSKVALVKYGVKGIKEYPYPVNQEQMQQLAESFSDDFVIVGDYAPTTAPISDVSEKHPADSSARNNIQITQ